MTRTRLGLRVSTAVAAGIVAFGLSGVAPSQASEFTFANRTSADGLGNTIVNGVFAAGSTIYAATAGGLSISTDGGANFTNRTTSNGLGSDYIYGVFASGTTIYAATAGGLSISTDGGANFTNLTTADGLGSDVAYGVFAAGITIYAATSGGLSIGSGSSDGGAATLPADVVQSVGRSAAVDCGTVDDRDLNWGGAGSGGWAPSWEQWTNGGHGGAVCTRTLYYVSGRGQWAVRP